MNINKYLDNIFSSIDSNIKLDAEQKRVVLNNNKNLLVIAGAGSGKTTVISAKVKYLTEIKKINPKEILLISFTNESVNDLKKQIHEKFLIPVSIKTFHQFGLEIIKKNKKIKIIDNLENILNTYFSRDIYFTNNYYEFLEYFLFYFSTYKKKKLKSFTNQYFNSIEELAINNFLEIYNIKVKYKVVNFNRIISQFIFNYKQKKVIINYLNKKTINKKKKNIIYINLVKGPHILNTLQEELYKLNIFNYKTIKIDDINYNSFIKLCYSFISTYKTNYSDYSYFQELSKKHINNKRLSLFLKVIFNAYKYYTKYNKNNNILDFNDIINEAIKILKINSQINYKYIIVDEFQDISKNRLKLLLLLKNIKIMAVGDDWQAIYGFAGSNIIDFLNFSKIVQNCSVLSINKTYRNSQQLIDIAGNFIMKNNNQIKKKLLSDKSINNPIIIHFYDNTNNLAEIIYNILTKINNKDDRILILGRYKFDIKVIIDKKYFDIKNNKLICLKENFNLSFLTVHASKGLTFDNVIILNTKNDIYGFPSQIIDDYEISILKNREPYFVAEERRLFYVALTRTKNKNYILAPISNPSNFILELMNDNISIINHTKKRIKKKIYICKNCGIPLKGHNKNIYCFKCKRKI